MADDNYTAPIFESTATIEKIHSVFRFGKSSNVTYFFTGTTEELIDYVLGVAVVSMILVSICLVWTCFLYTVKRRGKKKFRWATGMLEKPKPPDCTENIAAAPQEVPTKKTEVNLEEHKTPIINTSKANDDTSNHEKKKTSQKIDWEMKSLMKSLNQNELDEINETSNDDDDDDSPTEDDEKKYILEIDYGSDESSNENYITKKKTDGVNGYNAVASTPGATIDDAKNNNNVSSSDRFEQRRASLSTSWLIVPDDAKGNNKSSNPSRDGSNAQQQRRRSSSIFGIEPRSSSNSIFGNERQQQQPQGNHDSSNVRDGVERRASSSSSSSFFGVERRASSNSIFSNEQQQDAVDVREGVERRTSSHSFGGGDVKERRASSNSFGGDVGTGNEVKKMNEEGDDGEYEEALAKVTKTLLYARVVFLICGVGTIVAILYSVLIENEKFLDSLKINEGILKNILRSIDNVIDQIDDFAQNSEYTQNSKFLFQDGEANWCTKIGQTQSDLVYDGDMIRLQSMVDNFTVGINALQSSMNGDAEVIRVAFVSFRTDIVDALDNLHLLLLALDVYTYSSYAQSGLTGVMMVGVIYAWRTGSSRFATVLSFWIFPLFAFVTFISVVSCIAFVSGTIATADYCSPSPDNHTIPLLDYLDIENAPMFLEMMDWYVQGCTGPRYILNIDDYIPVVENAIVTTDNFMDGLAKINIARLDRLCGRGAKFPTALVNATHGSINNLARGLDGMQKWLSCATINGIYTSIAYDEVCYKIINILQTICLLQLAIVFGSMIMITLRVAWTQLETVDMTEKEDESVKSAESVDDIKKPLRVHSSIYS